MSSFKAYLEICALALLGSSIAFAANVEVRSSFIQSATNINYSLPDAATRASLVSCFRDGVCTQTPAGHVRNYPLTNSAGQMFSGCYSMRGGDLQRIQDLDADGGCGVDPNGKLKVLLAYRMECPGGSATCTKGGTLKLGCSLESLGVAGPSNPFLGMRECIGGAPIVIDALARNLANGVDDGGTGGSTPPSGTTVLDPANCKGKIQFSDIVKPSQTGESSGAFQVNLVHSETEEPISWGAKTFSPDPGAGLTQVDDSTYQLSSLSEGSYSIQVDYLGDVSTQCHADAMIQLEREPCSSGYSFNPDFGSACIPCHSGSYKSISGSSSCESCPPVLIPNATELPWFNMTTSPASGATSVNDCRPQGVTCNSGFTYNPILRSCEKQNGCGWSIALAPTTDDKNAFMCYGYALVNPDPGGFFIPDNGQPRTYNDSNFRLRLKPDSPSSPIPGALTFSGDAIFNATGGSQVGAPVPLPGGDYVVEFTGISKGDFTITAKDGSNCTQTATVSIPPSYDSCSNFACPAGTSQFLYVLPGNTEANTKTGLPNYVSDVSVPSWITDLDTDLVGTSCYPGGSTKWTSIYTDTARPLLERLGYRISMPPAVSPYDITNNLDNGNQQNMAGQCILSQTGTNVVRFVQRACVPFCGTLPLGELPVNKRPTQCSFDGKTYYKTPGTTCN